MSARTINSPTSRSASDRTGHRRARRSSLARIGLVFLLGACTTPNQAGRLLFQRGATTLPSPSSWEPFEGQIAIQELDGPAIRKELESVIDRQLKPRRETADLSLRLQGVILGCRGGSNASCACRVVVEVVGNDRSTPLRAMEGRAELKLARQADRRALTRALSALVGTAIKAALTANDKRPTPHSEMERLIRQGSTKRIQDWARALEGTDASDTRRITLWIGLGHVGTNEHLTRLEKIKPKTDREAEVRARALRWIRAASARAGKTRPADVESGPGVDGDRP